MLPYLINSVERGARPKPTRNKENKMAKKRKKARSAAQKAATRKMLAANKARKAPKRAKHSTPKAKRQTRKSLGAAAAPRKRHQVKPYHRKGGQVKSYHRHGANVPLHWSNPFGIRGLPGDVVEVAMAGLVGLAALGVTYYAIQKAQEKFSVMNRNEWANIAAQAAIAGALIFVVRKGVKNPQLRMLATAGIAMAPVMTLGMKLVPQLMSKVPVSSQAALPPAPPAQAARDSALGAMLTAQLTADTQDYEMGYVG